MNEEPLKNKGEIDEITRKSLELKFFREDGTEYKGKIAWDFYYNSFDNEGKLLTGKYFDDEGNEIKQTVFSVGSVKSAVEFYKKYKDNPALLMKECPKHYKEFTNNRDKYPEFVDYCFSDVIEW